MFLSWLIASRIFSQNVERTHTGGYISVYRDATTAEKLRGTKVWVPAPRAGPGWAGCWVRGRLPPLAVRVRGYHPRKICENSDAKSCILVTTWVAGSLTLCDLIWHAISCSGVVISITNCYIRFTLLYFTLLYLLWNFLLFENYGQEVGGPIVGPANLKVGDQSPPVPTVVAPMSV